MKHVFLALVLASSLLAAGCSDSDVDVNTRAIPPLHYSQDAPDLIDVSRFDARAAAGNPEDFKLADAVGKAGETLGAALDNDSRTRVLVKKKAAEGEKQKYTDNYLIQVATETGIKTVMARLDAAYESELFALDEAALFALPFRFMVVPNGESMVHVCMVDPVAYLRQFTPVSKEVRKKLQEAAAHFEAIIQAAFPNAVFDPRKQSVKTQAPENSEPMITLGQKAGALDSVSKALENGTLYYKNIAFKSGMDAFGDGNGSDGPEDIFNLCEDPATRPLVEIRGFVPFGTFKDFRKGSTFNIPNMTDTMAFLVENTIIHIFDGSDRRQVYDVNGRTVYQLQVFDANVDPMLISRGVSHFASVPMSVYLTEANGLVTVTMQNPEFKVLRYYSDISPALLESLNNIWNATDPPNKLLWPDQPVAEFGAVSLSTCQKVFDAAMSAL